MNGICKSFLINSSCLFGILRVHVHYVCDYIFYVYVYKKISLSSSDIRLEFSIPMIHLRSSNLWPTQFGPSSSVHYFLYTDFHINKSKFLLRHTNLNCSSLCRFLIFFCFYFAYSLTRLCNPVKIIGLDVSVLFHKIFNNFFTCNRRTVLGPFVFWYYVCRPHDCEFEFPFTGL